MPGRTVTCGRRPREFDPRGIALFDVVEAQDWPAAPRRYARRDEEPRPSVFFVEKPSYRARPQTRRNRDNCCTSAQACKFFGQLLAVGPGYNYLNI